MIAQPPNPGTNAVVREFEEHLSRIRSDAKGDLEQERQTLYLLALEREELATIGYGGDSIQARILKLKAPDAVRALVGHALRWAARDERTHAVLARGLLLSRRKRLLALEAFVTNFAGLIAGWASAVLQHTSFRRAPLSTVAAFFIAQSGRLLGKVPKTAAGTLQTQRFLEFCRFQADAEETAALSWERIAILSEDDGASPDGAAVTIARRIALDERKHRQLFQVFLESFDADDGLVAGIDADGLTARLISIDPSFVGSTREAGHQARVFVREHAGADPEGLRQLLRRTLVDTGLLREAMSGLPAGPRVAVKTTFMMGYDRRDPSPHVDLTLARELAVLLREHGATDVAFLEAPNHYDWYFGGRSVAQVATYLGFTDQSYRIVDVSLDQTPHHFSRGIAQSTISGTWKQADLRLSFAKMRSHPSWLCHLSLNTLETLGRRIDELLFLDRQADLLSGLMMVFDGFPPHLAVLDATHHVPDGLTGVLGDPTPCHPGRLYAAKDPIALDFVASRHMGLPRFPRDSTLMLASDWFEDPRPWTTVDGTDAPISSFKSPHRNDATVLLSAMAYPVYSWGGDRGSWWLPLMDSVAFPMLHRETVVQAIVRRGLRALFGFGRPAR